MIKPSFLIAILLLSCCGNCLSQNLKGASSEVAIAPPTGNVYALVVGVSDYESPMINDLKYAAADAKSVAEYLKAAPIKLQKIIELYDKEAKRATINEKGIRVIDDLIFDHTIKPEDIVLVYLSGHGGAFTKNDSYFFPHDAAHTTDAGSSFSITRIKGYIRNWVKESKATVIFIFDACRSATLAKGQSEMDLSEVSKYLEEETGEMLMAASQGGEPAQEKGELKHGVFTFYFLEALYGKADLNKDGFVSSAELKRYVDTNVDDATGQAQQPMIRYPVGYQRKVLVAVQPELLAKVDEKLKLDLTNQNIVALAQKGGNSTKKAVELSELIGKFNAALNEDRLVRPVANCAYSYYKQMTKLAPENTLQDYLTDLSIKLYDAALTVVKHDLNGERKYIKQTKDSKKGYDLTYYSDAALAIKTYIELKKRNMEPSILAVKEYLTGRDLHIQWNESENNEKIKAAIEILKAATSKFADQAFLWQALAMAYLAETKPQYKKVEDAANMALKLAPQWSYPLVTLAQSALDQDKPKEAELLLEKAINLNRFDYFSYDIKGSMYYDRGDVETAIISYQKAIELSPQDSDPYTNLGNALSDVGRREEAIIQYKKAIELAPKGYGIYNNLGVVLDDLGRKEEAIIQYKKAIEIDPKRYEAFSNLGRVLSDLGRKEEAIIQYQKAVEINPKEIHAFDNLGVVLSFVGRKEEAIVQFKKAIEINPKNSNSYIGIGIALGDLERREEAIIQLQKAIEVSPNDYGTLTDVGLVLNDLGYKEDAVTLYRKAIEIDPKRYEAYFNLGSALDDLGHKEEALLQYQKVIELNPEDSDSFINLGLILSDLGRKEEAIVQYKKAIEINPKDYGTHTNLGLVLSDAGRKEEAIIQHQKAIEIDPKRYEAFSNLGLVLNDVGRKEEAIIQYQKAIEIDPKNANPYYGMGIALDDLGRKDEAILQYRKAIEINPEDFSPYSNLIALLINLDRKREAIILYEKYLVIDPDSKWLYYRLAGLQQELGLKTDAIANYNKALEKATDDISLQAWCNFKLGKQEEAIKLAQQNIQNNPLGENYYILVRFYSLQNNKEKALVYFEIALEKGYNDWADLETDKDIKFIRELPEFKALLTQFKK